MSIKSGPQSLRRRNFQVRFFRLFICAGATSVLALTGLSFSEEQARQQQVRSFILFYRNVRNIDCPVQGAGEGALDSYAVNNINDGRLASYGVGQFSIAGTSTFQNGTYYSSPYLKDVIPGRIPKITAKATSKYATH